MKKILFLIMISFLCAFVTNAQTPITINNPKDADGFYIVKWDCAKEAFATSNDIEADETFTFAVDITGTAFEDWLKATPTNDSATRSLCFNKWTNWGALKDATARLKQIKGNIYGSTWNIYQMATEGTADSLTIKSVKKDSVVFIYGQIFGFEFTATKPGAGWWMWPVGVDEGANVDPGTGSVFKTLPYTGTKTSPELYSDDYEGGLFLSNNKAEKGYTLPCAVASEPVSLPNVPVAEVKVISHEFYNIVGVRLQKAPLKGLYIHKELKADGTCKVTKIFKQ